MRIGIDATWLATDRRGMGRYVAAIVTRLLERPGIDVVLFARDPKSPVAERLQRPVTLLPWDDPSLHRLDVCWYPWNRIDRPARTKRAVTIHDTAMVDWPAGGYLFAWLDNRHMKRMLAKAVERADRIMAPSRFTQERLLALFDLPPARIDVVSEGYEELSDEGVAPVVEGRFLLYVGAADARKNVPALLEAWRMVAAQVHPVRLVMVGMEAGEEVPGVTWPGRVTDPQLGWLYRNCAAVVVPSLYEGFGLPLLEAMAAGAPVASSHATSLPEVGGQVPEYFDPKQPADMARALLAVLWDGEKAARMRRAGIEQARAFTWERATDQVLASLERTRFNQTPANR
ncbi:MAG: glycosyltransferase family 4 protein [Candidatus Xenobia bacterium]